MFSNMAFGFKLGSCALHLQKFQGPFQALLLRHDIKKRNCTKQMRDDNFLQSKPQSPKATQNPRRTNQQNHATQKKPKKTHQTAKPHQPKTAIDLCQSIPKVRLKMTKWTAGEPRATPPTPLEAFDASSAKAARLRFILVHYSEIQHLAALCQNMPNELVNTQRSSPQWPPIATPSHCLHGSR